MSSGYKYFERFSPNRRESKMSFCNICPRNCRVDRDKNEYGFCRVGRDAVVSHVCKHFYEEPIISGIKGSGAVFFGGCNLSCVFCQNKSISRAAMGKAFDSDALAELFLKVEESGVCTLNLVTPTPHARIIASALEKIKHRLTLPVVYNTSAYESVDTLKMMNGLVDVYLPDIKYADESKALRYSRAENYPSVAFAALEEMLSQQPACIISDGIIRKGVVVRHLCLPSSSRDSLAVVERLAGYLDRYDFKISLMSQYTPDFLGEYASEFKEINRKITGLEYDRVSKKVEELGFDGFFQERESACKRFTPEFDAEGFRKSERIEIDGF